MQINTNYIAKMFSIVAVFLCLGYQLVFAQAVDTVLDANANVVNVGQTVLVNLTIEPDGGEPVYTVSANLVYDPKMLEFVSAQTDTDWLELIQSDVSITDVINGLIVRTAGYPNGFLGKAKFVTYKFTAKKTGNTRILTAAGQAYNDNNSNIGLKNTDLNLTIAGGEANILEQKVLDVSIQVDGDNAFYRQDPYVFTVYHKKEEKHQQAITKIWVFDEAWNVHYEDEKLWRTDQDSVLNFLIPADSIKQEGNFTIIAKVRYEDGEEFEVAEKHIGILSNGETWFTKNSRYFFPFFFVIIFVSALHHVFMEREVYFKMQSYLKRGNRGKISARKSSRNS